MTLKAGDFVQELELIGSSGQGDVFRVLYHMDPSEEKIGIRLKKDSSPSAVERFRRRARFSHSLGDRHPEVFPRTHRLVVQDGDYWILMEKFDSDLDRYCQGHALGWVDSACLLAGPLYALHVLHSQGQTHRDVKPQNMLINVQERRVVLTDLGVMDIPGFVERLTAAGRIVGTCPYVHPAAFTGSARAAGRLLDLYAWYVSWYELANGDLPAFDGDSWTFLRSVLTETPIPLREALGDIFSSRPPTIADAIPSAQRMGMIIADLLPEVITNPLSARHFERLMEST